MTTPDIVNSLFEIFGGSFVALSICRLYRDKQTRGLSLWHPFFFLCWGYWNPWYYSQVQSPLSAIGALGVALANTAWFLMIIYYRCFYNRPYEAI